MKTNKPLDIIYELLLISIILFIFLELIGLI
jgi:hypothetical protein